MSKWSDTKVTVQEIRESNNVEFLLNVLLDQQHDYWYDPCGKSGHDLKTTLTEKSRWAMKRLKALKWHGEKIEKPVLDEIVDATRDQSVEFRRGLADAKAGHTPALLGGPYMEGYSEGCRSCGKTVGIVVREDTDDCGSSKVDAQ